MSAALAAVALALSAAAAPAPAGFVRSDQLTVRAARISGATHISGAAARVYCARDFRSWAAFMRRNGLGQIAAEIEGLTRIERGETFLHPRVCLRLHRWLSGRPVPLEALADAVFTFAHEAAHLSGVVNECATDRWAVARLARVARDLFGIRSPERRHALVRLARAAAGYVEAC
jgi:hypothetical protein